VMTIPDRCAHWSGTVLSSPQYYWCLLFIVLVV